MGKGGAHGSLTPRIFGESRNRYEHLRCHLTWHCRIGIDFQGIYGHNNLITPKPSLLFSSIIEVIRDFSPGTGGGSDCASLVCCNFCSHQFKVDVKMK